MSHNLTLDIEQIKKEKDGLDVLADIYIYAVLGEKVSSSDLERFKWYGLYQQKDDNNYFELKIPISMGELNIEQLKTLCLISKEYANDSLSISSAQKVELKWLKIHHLPNIFKLLQDVNLNTFFEAGHNVRRVLTCPVNGIDSEQLFDVEKLANSLNSIFIGNRSYSNLPNKLQMAISGYTEGCALENTPDVSFNATKDEKDKIIFCVKVLDRTIGYITPSQVTNTARAIAKIFRDFGDRKTIENSSFENLVKSWGFDKFYNILNSSINYKMKKFILINNSEIPRKPRMGVNESKIEGQSYIGCVINPLEIKSSSFDLLAKLLEKHEASKIKITHKGNIIILDSPTKNANSFAQELQKINFNPFV